MNKKFNLLAMIMLVVLSLNSCATIMHGTHQRIGISSYPSNASVWVDQVYLGSTPMLVDLTRKDNHFVRIEIPGYMPYEGAFSRQLSGWVFGNIIFGGVIGLAVDAITGGIYKLTPDQIQVQLNVNNYPVRGNGDSFIGVVLEADPSWQKIGNMEIE